MTDPIFTGNTRPAMPGGVTYAALVFCIMCSAILVIVLLPFTDYGIFAAAIFVPLYAICRLIESGEPRTFRLLWLAIKAKAPCLPNRSIWGGNCSVSPFGRRRY